MTGQLRKARGEEREHRGVEEGGATKSEDIGNTKATEESEALDRSLAVCVCVSELGTIGQSGSTQMSLLKDLRRDNASRFFHRLKKKRQNSCDATSRPLHQGA